MKSVILTIAFFTLPLLHGKTSETKTKLSDSSKASTTSQELDSEQTKSDQEKVESIYVFGSQDKTFMTPGSAQFIPKKEVKKLDYTDATRILQTVPGVYVQEEDGLGLRANIGLRGSTPNRSKKITLMEDGIVIAPAPYSAPAAYFFPNALRTEDIEVFKGFSSSIYGPNSIGGAVNFVTTPIGNKNEQRVEATIGRVRKYKATTTGPLGENFGYLLELSRMDSDGIKKLPNNGDTGFEKNDVMLKFNFKPGKRSNLSLKATYSNEDANETYLGLSPEDFNTDPYRRYAASERDNLEWNHQQVQLRYDFKINDNADLKAVAYYHQFERNWSKLSNFREGAAFGYSLSDYVNPASPNFEAYYKDVLEGKLDSTLASGDDSLIIGDNDRTYYSTGIQLESEINNSIGASTLQTKVGLRMHRDRIRRNHFQNTYAMTNGRLRLNTAFTTEIGTQNKDRATAVTPYLSQELDFNNGFILSWGGRYEYIDTQRIDYNNNYQLINNYQQVWAPGAGLQYSPTNTINLFVGVNQGVSAISPGQEASVKPEKSTNYEMGLKFNNNKVRGEAIAFYNDYNNIKGFCSFSSGCLNANLDKEFNGGEAEIIGLETMIGSEVSYKAFKFPLSATYTYTQAEFSQKLQSDNSEWGIGTINPGDPLPYIPKNKLSLSAGLQYKKFEGNVRYNIQSKTFDQSVEENRQTVKGYDFVDVITTYKYSKNGTAILSVDNLLDEDYAVSLRPAGLRPGKPRSINVGFRHVF